MPPSVFPIHKEPQMKYTLRQLQIFLEVAQQQSISRAAQSLHMSQSAASEALQNLEHAYEIALFDRASNKLILNAVGQTVRKEAQSLLEHAQSFEEVLQSHKELGHIKVGASFTIGNHLATRYLAGYLGQYPGADVTLDIANTPEIVARVLNYEVDIGMIEGEVQHRELELIPWRDDELVVFCAANHPLASKSSLSTRDIKSAAWILREPDSGARQTFDKAMAGLLPELNVFMEFKHNEAIKNAVESGLGIGCLSRIVLQRNFSNGDLVPLTLPRRDMRRTFYFALPRKRFGLESVRFWMDTCRSVDA
jgi:DNA-binding transcriptional LysR family regulator